MGKMHALAAELNETLMAHCPAAYALLSEKGKNAYFPRAGILSQAADADGARYNATIGIALEDDHSPMRLDSIADGLNMDPKDALPYAPAHGKRALREAWQARIVANTPSLSGSCITLPVATAGLTHALSIVGQLFLDPAQSLALATPYWDNYAMIFAEMHGAVLSPFDLFHDGRFNVDGLRVALAGTDRKISVLLNFPNNPTGYSPMKDEVDGIIAAFAESAARGNRLFVIVDDAYAGLTYDDAQRESLFGALANLHGNVLAAKIDGPSKEDFAWGLRVGFVTYGMKGLTAESAAALEEKTAGIVRATVSSGSNLSQSLILRSLQDPASALQKDKNVAVLRERFDETMRILHTMVRYREVFEALPCNSGYFVCLKPATSIDVEAVRQTLLRDYSTGVVATNGLLRVAFSSVPKADLPALFENIFSACLKVKNTDVVYSANAEDHPSPVVR